MRGTIRLLAGAIVALMSVAWSQAGDVTLRFSPSTNTRRERLTVLVGHTHVGVTVEPNSSATQKRDAVSAALGRRFSVSDDGPLGSSLTIHGVAAGDAVAVRTGQTGEVEDRIVSLLPDAASVTFGTTFDPFDRSGQPAMFTAGIVTDVGELSVNVSATELSFQTDGPIICQALFQRLAPRAPQYGAQINYSGDRLEIYFDPAFTVTQGGVIFGTSSPSSGLESVLTPEKGDEKATLQVDGVASPGGTFDSQLAVKPQFVFVQLGPLASAQEKRDTIQQHAAAAQMSVLNAWGTTDTLLIRDLGGRSTVSFSTGSTGEASDRLKGATVSQAAIGFGGLFQPICANNQPAVFTAGIVTDVGELSANVSAAELSFQTDGPIICQALFQRLAPRAPQYGAQINYAGDRLEIYFDPAYTVTRGGVVFGTSSLTPGCTGTIIFPNK
jgi:hypothetical protein